MGLTPCFTQAMAFWPPGRVLWPRCFTLLLLMKQLPTPRPPSKGYHKILLRAGCPRCCALGSHAPTEMQDPCRL